MGRKSAEGFCRIAEYEILARYRSEWGKKAGQTTARNLAELASEGK
jgi:hypothetical protein